MKKTLLVAMLMLVGMTSMYAQGKIKYVDQRVRQHCDTLRKEIKQGLPLSKRMDAIAELMRLDPDMKNVVKRNPDGSYTYKTGARVIVHGNAYSWPFQVPELLNHPEAWVTCTISKTNLKVVFLDDCQLECDFWGEEDRPKGMSDAEWYGDARGAGKSGSPKKPKDPFKTELCSKKGGETYLIPLRTFYSGVTDTCNAVEKRQLDAKFSYSCTHKSWQFPIRSGGGYSVSAGAYMGGGQPFAPWKFKHTCTLTYNFDEIAKRNGLSKRDLVTLMTQGMLTVAGSREMLGNDRLYFMYCMHKVFNVTEAEEEDFNRRQLEFYYRQDAHGFTPEQRDFILNSEDRSEAFCLVRDFNAEFEEAQEVMRKGDCCGAVEKFQSVLSLGQTIQESANGVKVVDLDLVRQYLDFSKMSIPLAYYQKCFVSVKSPDFEREYNILKNSDMEVKAKVSVMNKLLEMALRNNARADAKRFASDMITMDTSLGEQTKADENLCQMMFLAHYMRAKHFITDGETKWAERHIRRCEELRPNDELLADLKQYYNEHKVDAPKETDSKAKKTKKSKAQDSKTQNFTLISHPGFGRGKNSDEAQLEAIRSSVVAVYKQFISTDSTLVTRQGTKELLKALLDNNSIAGYIDYMTQEGRGESLSWCAVNINLEKLREYALSQGFMDDLYAVAIQEKKHVDGMVKVGKDQMAGQATRELIDAWCKTNKPFTYTLKPAMGTLRFNEDGTRDRPQAVSVEIVESEEAQTFSHNLMNAIYGALINATPGQDLFKPRHKQNTPSTTPVTRETVMEAMREESRPGVNYDLNVDFGMPTDKVFRFKVVSRYGVEYTPRIAEKEERSDHPLLIKAKGQLYRGTCSIWNREPYRLTFDLLDGDEIVDMRVEFYGEKEGKIIEFY